MMHRLSTLLAKLAKPRTALLLSVGCISMLAASLARAQSDPMIHAAVTAVPATASLSRAQDAATSTNKLDIYAAYLVALSNGTPANLNAASWVGTLSGNSPGDLPTVVQVSGVPVTCSIELHKVTCSVAQLAPGDVSNFYVVVKTPITAPGGGALALSWSFSGSEGKSYNGCCSEVGSASTQLVDALSTTGKTHLITFVDARSAPKSYFTGPNGIATPTDPITTQVTVPTYVDSVTTATIDENEATGGFCKGTKGCVTTKLSIPHGKDNSGPYFAELSVILSRDASTLLNSAKADDLSVTYTPDDPTKPSRVLVLCTDAVGPMPSIPCISYRKIYGNQPSWGDRAGDGEIGIRAVDNGKFDW